MRARAPLLGLAYEVDSQQSKDNLLTSIMQ